jgi:hypothetical protein
MTLVFVYAGTIETTILDKEAGLITKIKTNMIFIKRRRATSTDDLISIEVHQNERERKELTGM